MITQPVTALHRENLEWIKRLDFYSDELRIMKARIDEIASKNTGKGVLAQVEHFQNQLILQRNHIDEIRHAVNDHENYISNRVKENPVAVEHRRLNDHPVLRERFDRFEQLFNALREELNAFLSRTF